MTIRTTLLPVLDKIRALLGPSGPIDFRPTSVTIIQQIWPGGRIGASNSQPQVLSTLVLNTGTKVRQVEENEVAESGGRLELGDVIVGPVTPQYSPSVLAPLGGGYTAAQLDPPVSSMGVENVYRLALQSGASGIAGDYQLREFRRDRSLRFELVLRRKIDTP